MAQYVKVVVDGYYDLMQNKSGKSLWQYISFFSSNKNIDLFRSQSK